MPELIDTADFSETRIVAATTVPETVKTDPVRILFTDNEVILDNAAGDHIFRCDKLLTGIRTAAVPTTMPGVSGVGFTVTKEGDFRDLCTAGWNAGCAIHYDDDRDEFLVLTPGSKSAWLFVRELKTDGRSKSPLYTCDMNKADSSVAVLVDTVAEKQLAFLIGALSPLGLNFCQHIKSRSFECVVHSLRTFINIAAGRDFAVKEVRVDGEGALAVMAPEHHYQHFGAW